MSSHWTPSTGTWVRRTNILPIPAIPLQMSQCKEYFKVFWTLPRAQPEQWAARLLWLIHSGITVPIYKPGEEPTWSLMFEWKRAPIRMKVKPVPNGTGILLTTYPLYKARHIKEVRKRRSSLSLIQTSTLHSSKPHNVWQLCPTGWCAVGSRFQATAVSQCSDLKRYCKSSLYKNFNHTERTTCELSMFKATVLNCPNCLVA